MAHLERSPEKMPHDSDIIIERVRARLPEAVIQQLKVVHPGADDDGLWYFRMPGVEKTIQIESSTYDLPFLIEHSGMKSEDTIVATSVDQAVDEVSSYLMIIRRDSK